ncbi:MAG: hypothetical protein A4E53_01721 [Pelotomaculum sp. PtaB.Bin104]|nr:MAG: hypothetical protein A4E53_01721 [Pelotomaculum sp. PtaB.Bin104]
MLTGFSDENNQVREVSYSDPLPVTTSHSGRLVTKTITFDGTAHKGQASSVIPLFTVTGNVYVKIFGICTKDLVSAGGGTLEVGVANNTAALIAQTLGTTIDSGEIWYDNTPVVGTTVATNVTERIIANGADIIGTVGTADITDGVITFYCYFQPFGGVGSVEAA